MEREHAWVEKHVAAVQRAGKPRACWRGRLHLCQQPHGRFAAESESGLSQTGVARAPCVGCEHAGAALHPLGTLSRAL